MKANRVCIVDDDCIARETSAALLAPAGYAFEFADSGQDLLDRIGELRPDVILLDVMMPGMDGFEVCQLLKSAPRWRQIPIILITALDSREDLIHGLNAGADEFLAKPVNGPELRARVRSMLRIKEQYDQLQATLRLRKDLASMIVHDMRVPLGAMMLYSQLMRGRGTLSEEDQADLEVIEGQAQRLDGFVTDVLQVAKMEEGRLILQASLVDVEDLVREIGEVHLAFAESKGIALSFELPNQAPEVALDASLIGRVVDNLVSNALKYSPSGSAVKVRLTFPASKTRDPALPRLRLEVLDEGPGIPVDKRETVFDKFKVAEAPHGKEQQFGLGLTFAKRVVEAHGGRISATENVPAGSVFTIEI